MSHLEDLSSVSDNLACIKHKPIGSMGKQTAHTTMANQSDNKYRWYRKVPRLPGKTKIKQAANPPISDITRPISGMKRARRRVATNQTSVCRMRLLRSRRTHTSTCSPWKRSHSPSITALHGKYHHNRHVYG